MRSLVILGSTGSVGTQALDVVRRNPDRFKVVGLSAGTNQELLIGQIREFLPPYVALADEQSAADLRERLSSIRGIEVLAGPGAAEMLARDTECDMVLNALVGSAGLAPTLAALQAGKTLALANKESLVIGGELVLDLIKGEPERLVPVDSEHAALAQCLRGERREDL
jgi:1-deoxy-D-xylulose-5-phosphate reductoisomerase